MAIRFSKYVNITSGVGAATVVATRELIGRIFTINPLLPTQSILEFDTAAEVGTYFGFSSVEYLRATYYFSWISKNITSPQSISFSRWTNANEPPMIFGARLTTSLTALELITNGSFSLTMGTSTFVVSGLNFSSAGSLTAIATIIQTAIEAETGGGAQWTGATVTYNSITSNFNLVGGSAVAAIISVAPGNTGTDISALIGWLPESINGTPGAIWSNGNLIETITQTLTLSASLSNNFGSFLFIPTLNLSQITEAAVWNNDQNISYIYCVPVDNLTDATTYQAATANYAGVGITLAPLTTQYPEQFPMMQLAATNYAQRNSTSNYMYQQTALTPSVTTDSLSDALDALRVNYYGQTQQAGQLLAFYQRGLLQGGATAPIDMNVYANEIWLRDAAGVAIMTLLLALSKVSANVQGRAQILTILQSVINTALVNGTISVGSNLTTTQILYINEITGDPNAWYQVQNIGYWIDCTIVSVIADGGNTEYQAVYTLVYKKDDVVRSVSGRHVLI